MAASAEPSAQADRVDSVQLLRAVAAISVVVFHVYVFSFDGTWGVDLFFVISGFIICYVTEGSRSRFLTKRLIRIVPLYWTGTIGVFLVSLAAPTLLVRSSPNVEWLFKSLAFIPFDKGDGSVQPLLFLGWTLNYEMFFYVLFAVSMAISHTWRGLICASLLGAIAIAGSMLTFRSVVLSFYSDNIIVEFIYGICAYAIYRRTSRWRTLTGGAWWRPLALAGGLGAMAVLPFTGPLVDDVGRSVARGLPAAVAFLLILFGLSGVRLPRPLTAVGDASYTLYLFHPYAIYLAVRTLPIDRSPVGMVLAVFVVVLCCGLAVLGYRFIEYPVIRWLRSRLVVPDRGELSARGAVGSELPRPR